MPGFRTRGLLSPRQQLTTSPMHKPTHGSHPEEELKNLLADSPPTSPEIQYSSKPLALGAVGIPSLALTIRKQTTMARHRATKILTTVLHGTIAVVSGCYTFYTLSGRIADRECLPPLLDYFGDPLAFSHGLPTICNVVTYVTAAICALSVVMGIGINCLWQSCGMMSMHLFISTVLTTAAVFGGTVFTVHNLLWCDSLTQKHTFYRSGCRTAAKDYDVFHKSDNMTWYYDRLQIQQAGMWAIVPLLAITIFIYAAVLRLGATDASTEDETSGNYRYVLIRNETTPLLNPLSSTQSHDSLRHRDGSNPPPPHYDEAVSQTQRGPSFSETATANSNPFESEADLRDT